MTLMPPTTVSRDSLINIRSLRIKRPINHRRHHGGGHGESDGRVDDARAARRHEDAAMAAAVGRNGDRDRVAAVRSACKGCPRGPVAAALPFVAQAGACCGDRPSGRRARDGGRFDRLGRDDRRRRWVASAAAHRPQTGQRQHDDEPGGPRDVSENAVHGVGYSPRSACHGRRTGPNIHIPSDVLIRTLLGTWGPATLACISAPR